MKRKILFALLLCLALALCLTACGTTKVTGEGVYEEESGCEHRSIGFREIRERTCTQTGIDEEYCLDCGEVFGTHEDPEPLGHEFVNYYWPYTEATCSTPDIYVYYCECRISEITGSNHWNLNRASI